MLLSPRGKKSTGKKHEDRRSAVKEVTSNRALRISLIFEVEGGVDSQKKKKQHQEKLSAGIADADQKLGRKKTCNGKRKAGDLCPANATNLPPPGGHDFNKEEPSVPHQVSSDKGARGTWVGGRTKEAQHRTVSSSRSTSALSGHTQNNLFFGKKAPKTERTSQGGASTENTSETLPPTTLKNLSPKTVQAKFIKKKEKTEREGSLKQHWIRSRQQTTNRRALSNDPKKKIDEFVRGGKAKTDMTAHRRCQDDYTMRILRAPSGEKQAKTR